VTVKLGRSKRFCVSISISIRVTRLEIREVHQQVEKAVSIDTGENRNVRPRDTVHQLTSGEKVIAKPKFNNLVITLAQ
jgi:hypothetical protein